MKNIIFPKRSAVFCAILILFSAAKTFAQTTNIATKSVAEAESAVVEQTSGAEPTHANPALSRVFSVDGALTVLTPPGLLSEIAAPRPAVMALKSSIASYPTFNVIALPKGEPFFQQRLSTIKNSLVNSYRAVGITDLEGLKPYRWQAADGTQRVSAELSYGNNPKLRSTVTWLENNQSLFIATYIDTAEYFEGNRWLEELLRSSLQSTSTPDDNFNPLPHAQSGISANLWRVLTLLAALGLLSCARWAWRKSGLKTGTEANKTP